MLETGTPRPARFHEDVGGAVLSHGAGMIRRMSLSNRRTVNPVSPCVRLRGLPLVIRAFRTGRGRGHLAPEAIGDVAGAMRSWAKIGHGAHVGLLRGCESVKRGAREARARAPKL